ncbi:hypothetical protein HPB48_010679 [Haemaphysalis longicornis]|uniref:Uncharacterized protein n=1 Tax=Haemaphysalis longicornis TaxID=44386 RepID=A0A9J6G586_HAELO|nr:hypothetical protein HPB48_010679 [Haemaphysalis longicornis]
MSSLANPASHSLGPDIPMFPKKGARPMTSAPFSCEAVSAPLSFIPPKFTVASTLALSAAVVYFSRSPSAVSKLWQELSCSCSRNLPLWFGEELLLGERGLGRRGGCAVVVRCSEEWGEGAGNGLRRHFSTADRARVTKMSRINVTKDRRQPKVKEKRKAAENRQEPRRGVRLD